MSCSALALTWATELTSSPAALGINERRLLRSDVKASQPASSWKVEAADAHKTGLP